MLIFSQHTRMMDVLEEFMELSNYKCLRIDGKVKGPERQTRIDKFMQGELVIQNWTAMVFQAVHS